MPPAELPALLRQAAEFVRQAGIRCADGGSRSLCECPPLLESACRNLHRVQSLLVSAAPELRAELEPAVRLLALRVANFSQLLNAAAGFHHAVWVRAGEDAVSYQPDAPAFHRQQTNSAEVVG